MTRAEQRRRKIVAAAVASAAAGAAAYYWWASTKADARMRALASEVRLLDLVHATTPGLHGACPPPHPHPGPPSLPPCLQPGPVQGASSSPSSSCGAPWPAGAQALPPPADQCSTALPQQQADAGQQQQEQQQQQEEVCGAAPGPGSVSGCSLDSSLDSHFSFIQQVSAPEELEQLLDRLQAQLYRMTDVGTRLRSLPPQASSAAKLHTLALASCGRAVGSAWLLPLTDLYVRCKLNVVGRHLFLQEKLAQLRLPEPAPPPPAPLSLLGHWGGSPSQQGQRSGLARFLPGGPRLAWGGGPGGPGGGSPPAAALPPPLAASTIEAFLACPHLLDTGCQQLVDMVLGGVEAVLPGVPLDCCLGPQALLQLLGAQLVAVEAALGAGQAGGWSELLVGRDAATQAARLQQVGSVGLDSHRRALAAASMLLELHQELRAALDSAAFATALRAAVQLCFSLLAQHLLDGAFPPQTPTPPIPPTPLTMVPATVQVATSAATATAEQDGEEEAGGAASTANTAAADMPAAAAAAGGGMSAGGQAGGRVSSTGFPAAARGQQAAQPPPAPPGPTASPAASLSADDAGQPAPHAPSCPPPAPSPMLPGAPRSLLAAVTNSVSAALHSAWALLPSMARAGAAGAGGGERGGAVGSGGSSSSQAGPGPQGLTRFWPSWMPPPPCSLLPSSQQQQGGGGQGQQPVEAVGGSGVGLGGVQVERPLARLLKPVQAAADPLFDQVLRVTEGIASLSAVQALSASVFACPVEGSSCGQGAGGH
ncbi:hypothetical protein V8C86DRAFT_852238 [Haematococcus lacustris]